MIDAGPALRADWRAVHAFNRANFNPKKQNMKNLIRSINRSPLRCGFFTVAIALCWFVLSPTLKAIDCPSTCPGRSNTGVGIFALDSVNPAVGMNNTALGQSALTNDTNGFSNVAVGSAALANNTTGAFITAIGADALKNNNANLNVAVGFRAGFQNTTGNHLTGLGAAAMRNNTTASFNTVIGAGALQENTTTISTSLLVMGHCQVSMAPRVLMELTRRSVALRLTP